MKPTSPRSLTPSAPRDINPFRVTAGTLLALAALGAASAHAQTTYNFTNATGDGSYNNGANWDQGTVPDLTTNNTAMIGAAPGTGVSQTATYTPGGDLFISNGGILRLAAGGTFTQAGGNNYIQLAGNGSVIVAGGTFNQGTDSANPFNIGGTGNAFTISSGSVILNTNFNLQPGLTYLQSGGTVTLTTGEFDFNNTTSTISGGTLITRLITGNNATTSSLTLSGGTIQITTNAFDGGFYAGGPTKAVNFTTGGTGQILFTDPNETIAQVQDIVNTGKVVFNGVQDPNSFTITQTANGISLMSIGAVVPEPSTVALGTVGAVALAVGMLRRRRAASAA